MFGTTNPDRTDEEILLEELVEEAKGTDQESFEECREFVRRVSRINV